MTKYIAFGLLLFILSSFYGQWAIKQQGKDYCKASGSPVWLYNGINYSCKDLLDANTINEYSQN